MRSNAVIVNADQIQATVVGLVCTIDPHKGHRFERSIIHLGADRCGRAIGMWTPCDQPRAAEIHQRGYEQRRQEVKHGLERGPARLQLHGLTRTTCSHCGGPVDVAGAEAPVCINCWLGATR